MLKPRFIRSDIVVSIFLVMITVAIFWQVKDHDFVDYDDNYYVYNNLQVQAGITPKSLSWAFTTFYASNWHPLSWLSHMLDVQFYGLKPGGHHATNLLFHITNTLLLFLILNRMTKALWRSAFVAAAFALHPLHVESVAWVAERKDVLSTFFWMLTMGAYLYYIERPGTQRYLPVLLFLALGLMSKPMLVTLPFVLLLLDYWPLGRLQLENQKTDHQKIPEKPANNRHKKKKPQRNLDKIPAHMDKAPTPTFHRAMVRQLVLEKVPLLALSLITCVITYIAQQKGGAVRTLDEIRLVTRIANAFVSYVSYIWKTVWPQNLAVYYPHPGLLPPWHVIGSVLFLILVTSLVIWTIKRFPYLAMGWFWYLGTLVPVIGFVQVGGQAMADRYTYVPLIGLFIMIAWGVPDLIKKGRHKEVILGISTGLIFLALIIVTWTQVQYWKTNVTLFKRALEATSNNYVAHSLMGVTLQEKGKLEEAVFHYTEALRIYPKSADAHNFLGTALQKQGRFKEAIAHYAEAIRINPNHGRAHGNLGDILTLLRMTDEAVIHYAEAIRIDPDNIKSYVNLGIALSSQGKYSDAMAYYSKAIQIKPDSVEAHYNMGTTMLLSRGNIAEAIEHLRETIRLKPDHAKAHYNLGNALLLQGKREEAIVFFREALRLNPDLKLPQYSLKDAFAKHKSK